MNNFKQGIGRVIVLVFIGVFAGCSSPKSLVSSKEGHYDYYALKDALKAYLNRPAALHIGDVVIECTITSLESDRVIIRHEDRMQEIPVRAISKITLADVKNTLMGTGLGSAAGGAAGWMLGKALSSKVLAKEWEKFKSDDKQMAAAVAGATTGFLIGAWLGSRSNEKSLAINPNVERLVLDRAVGESITETKRQMYGIFNDLPLQPTESLAHIQVMQYGPTDYLVIYDSFEQPTLPKYAYDGREVTIKVPAAQMKMHWMPVSRDYLVKQQEKIYQKLNKDGQDLKYRLFQQ